MNCVLFSNNPDMKCHVAWRPSTGSAIAAPLTELQLYKTTFTEVHCH